MNYLAHAWVLPPGGPDLVLGAALADLLRGLDRRLPRLDPGRVDRLEAAGAVELARGARAHHVADVSFHGLEAFHGACAGLAGLVDAIARASVEDGPPIGDLLRDAQGSSPEGGSERSRAARPSIRGFFLGHVLVELLIDAELLAASPGLAPSFYDALGAADRASAARALERASAAGGEPGDRAWTARTSSAFVTQLDRFLEARFVLDYATDEGLALRLGQLLGRARQRLGPRARALLLDGLPAARTAIRGALPALTDPPRAAVRAALGVAER